MTEHLRRQRLDQLKAVVDRGFRTFVEVGEALREIHDDRLYLETHSTFEDFCREHWDVSRAQGYRLIDSARVVRELSPIGDTPANEAQARELVPLLHDPALLRHVWGKLVTAYPVHRPAAKIRDYVSEFVNDYSPKPLRPDLTRPDLVGQVRREILQCNVCGRTSTTLRLGEKPAFHTIGLCDAHEIAADNYKCPRCCWVWEEWRAFDLGMWRELTERAEAAEARAEAAEAALRERADTS